MHKNALIVFVKNPIEGNVKTRLAKEIGDLKALEIYLELMEITRINSKEADCEKHVFYSDFVPENDVWTEDGFHQFLQNGQNLGARMYNAFKKIFAKGHENVAIIGSDCPQISTDLINSAFDSLKNQDAVIGPAKDGGYYLLGLKKLEEQLFVNKNWSTDSVLDDTLENFKNLNWKVEKLTQFNDIDTLADLLDYYNSNNTSSFLRTEIQ